MKAHFPLTLLLVVLLLNPKMYAQDLDKSLVFQTAITLSNDTAALPKSGTIITKSYTVPMGSVLKITSGKLSSLIKTVGQKGFGYVVVNSVFLTTLKVNGNTIIGRDVAGQSSQVQENITESASIINIDAKNPIWVPEGETIVLSTIIKDASMGGSGIFGSWINGLVFRITSR